MTLGNPYQTIYDSVDLLWGVQWVQFREHPVWYWYSNSPQCQSNISIPFLGSRANISQNESVTFSLVLGLENTGYNLEIQWNFYECPTKMSVLKSWRLGCWKLLSGTSSHVDKVSLFVLSRKCMSVAVPRNPSKKSYVLQQKIWEMELPPWN